MTRGIRVAEPAQRDHGRRREAIPPAGPDEDGKVSANGLKSPHQRSGAPRAVSGPGGAQPYKGGLLMKKVYVRIALIASSAVALLLAGGAGRHW